MSFTCNALWFMGRAYFEGIAAQVIRFDADPEAVRAFIERVTDAGTEGHTFLQSGDVAHIPVIGALVNAPDFFLHMMGGGSTVYGDIIRDVKAANADPNIKTIQLEISSAGGDIVGFFDAAEAIRNSEKPIEAHVTGFALSAAYGLAAQADRIVLDNVLGVVGSVGVATQRFVSEHEVTITSTDAPDKKPDASTPEGVAAIRAELDEMHVEFAGIIAAGRAGATGKTVTTAQVNRDFGRGANVIAKNALAAGMIDAINSVTEKKPAAKAGSKSKASGGVSMDLVTLKNEHPAVYAAVLALGKVEGVAEGTDAERLRCQAHIEMGKAGPKAALFAVANINSGADLTNPLVTAQYLNARGNAAAVADLIDDNGTSDTGTAPDGSGDGSQGADDTVTAEAKTDADTLAAFKNIRSRSGRDYRVEV